MKASTFIVAGFCWIAAVGLADGLDAQPLPAARAGDAPFHDYGDSPLIVSASTNRYQTAWLAWHVRYFLDILTT